jgi:hypothetical protein
MDWRHRRWALPLADAAYRQAVWLRIRENVKVTESGCWEWCKSRTEDGYGQISVKRRMARVHVVALAILLGGVWADWLEIDHKCRNRACCNPRHLELVTSIENYRRGLGNVPAVTVLRSKDRCKQGHLYTEENTYLRPSRKSGHNPSRRCRKCRTDGMARAYWGNETIRGRRA